MLYGLPITGNTWWLSLGLFCSIMLIYSVDHIRDIKVLLASKKNNEKLVLGYKIIATQLPINYWLFGCSSF